MSRSIDMMVACVSFEQVPLHEVYHKDEFFGVKDTGTNKTTSNVFMVIVESTTGPVDPATILQAILGNATRPRF